MTRADHFYYIVIEVIVINKYIISLEEAITYQNFYNALKKCNDDVSYKFSVQEYDLNCATYIHDSITSILNGEIPYVRKVLRIIIKERGKERIITPIYIGDRVIQKVLCDNVLIPSIMPHLIYDNGASIKGKGVDFARQRVDKFIEDAKRHYGVDNIYIVSFDVKSYFDTIPHALCKHVLDRYIYDDRISRLVMGIIESYHLAEIKELEIDDDERNVMIDDLFAHKCNGICLGSQISQIMAGAVLNEFDHYIKDILRVKYYERYMDDGLIICKSKQEANELLDKLHVCIESLGLQFNRKKTRVIKASKGFEFLKVKYTIKSDSKTVKRLNHRGIAVQKRKLRSFRDKVDNGRMTLDDVYNSMQSWLSHSKVAKNSYKSVKSVLDLYDDLFGGYKLTKKYFKAHPEVKKKK